MVLVCNIARPAAQKKLDQALQKRIAAKNS
jgi:hypothetical protein